MAEEGVGQHKTHHLILLRSSTKCYWVGALVEDADEGVGVVETSFRSVDAEASSH